MHDRVADVLAQRAALDRGAGVGIALSVVLHGGVIALAIYAALHAPPPKQATMVTIQFPGSPAPAISKPRAKPAAPVAPRVEEPKPKIDEPKPKVDQTPPKPEKNTVPLSPFGQSTKKGSETPAPAKPAPQPAAPATSTAPEVPVGGSGVTGLEGGDFPYTLYLGAMHRRIGHNWYRGDRVAPGTTAVIYFRILRNGTITDARIETSSGNAVFDRGALSAVRSSNPLNPLPFGFDGTFLGVHLTFR